MTSLRNIHCNEQKMIPVACSVNDLLNFCSELTTHHRGLISCPSAFHEKTGEILENCFDLEEMYFQQDKKVPDFFLEDLDLKGSCANASLDKIYVSLRDPGVVAPLPPERNLYEEVWSML